MLGSRTLNTMAVSSYSAVTPVLSLNQLGSGNLTIEPLHTVKPIWNRLVHEDPNSSLYHSERWISLLERTYRFRMFVALLKSGSEVRAACALARVGKPFARRFVALPFSDSCPPLANSAEARTELLRSLPQNRKQSYEIRGSKLAFPWQTVTCFNSWRIDYSFGRSQLYRNLSSNFRRNIAKAQRAGVTIKRGCDRNSLERFRCLHEVTRHQHGLPTQPVRFFRVLHQLFSEANDLQVWTASLHGRDLAAIVLLHHGRAVYYKWSARTNRDVTGAGHLLLWNIIEEWADRCEWLDLGRSDERNLGLSRFKRETGAVRIPLPYSFVPRAPREISPEIPSTIQNAAAPLWRHMPITAYRLLGSLAYKYLT